MTIPVQQLYNMKIRLSILFPLFLLLQQWCSGQVSLVNFPDSCKTSSLYYSPIDKPISKSAMWGVLSVGQPFDSICWPNHPVYDPDMELLHQFHKPGQPGILVIVDTQQKIDCYEYVFWYEKGHQYYPDKKVGYFEEGKYKFLDAAKTNQVQFIGYPVYLVNVWDTTVRVVHRKYSFPLVQEAMDKNGKWKPIEALFQLPPGAVVTGYYGFTNLKPGEMIISSIYNYKGPYQTMLRVKIMIDGKAYYSQPFRGSINYSQITSTKTYKFN